MEFEIDLQEEDTLGIEVQEDILKGENGKSAYELAVDNGYTGTIQQWLQSLKGKDGKDGVDGKDRN